MVARSAVPSKALSFAANGFGEVECGSRWHRAWNPARQEEQELVLAYPLCPLLEGREPLLWNLECWTEPTRAEQQLRGMEGIPCRWRMPDQVAADNPLELVPPQFRW